MKNKSLNLPLLFLLGLVVTVSACDVERDKLTLLYTGDALGSIEPCG